MAAIAFNSLRPKLFPDIPLSLGLPHPLLASPGVLIPCDSLLQPAAETNLDPLPALHFSEMSCKARAEVSIVTMFTFMDNKGM